MHIFKKLTRIILPILTVLCLIVSASFLPFEVSAATIHSDNGLTFDGDSNWSYSGGTIKGSGSTTLTITNTGSSQGDLTITYSGTYQGAAWGKKSSVTVFSTTYTSNGGSLWNTPDAQTYASGATASVNLAAGASTTIVLTQNGSCNISFTYSWVTEASVDATFNPVEGVAYTVNGTTISGSAQTLTTVTTTGYTIAAPSGYTLIGAIYETDGVKSGWTSDGSAFKPAAACTVTPVFMEGTTMPFTVGSTGYANWHAAMHAAATGSTKTVVVAANYTLPSGADVLDKSAVVSSPYVSYSASTGVTYTVPSGVTLNVPYDTAGTLTTTSPTLVTNLDSTGTYGIHIQPTIFRTLTVPSGVHINVSGAVALSSRMDAGMPWNGQPTQETSCLKLASGATMNFKSGSNLYAWGYLVGTELGNEGSVTMESGSTVYECFQIGDWRGGSATSGMLNNSSKVFPMSQYYIQNVQVPLTLNSGSFEKAVMAVDVTLIGKKTSTVPMIGSDGMFRVTSGSVTKDYDEKNDRQIYSLNGAMTVAGLSMDINLSVISTTIDSTKYNFPITNNLTINVGSGSKVTVNQDIAFLPGSQLNIAEGGTVTMGSGMSAYVYDKDNWGLYCGSSNLAITPVQYAVYKQVTRTADSLVDAKVQIDGTLDATAGYLYTTDKGANVCSVGSTGVAKITSGTATATYQGTQSVVDGEQTMSYTAIPVTSAQLKNADGSFVSTAGSSAKDYSYNGSIWTTECVHQYAETITTPAGCTTTGVKTFTCSLCGDSYTEEIPATNHTPVEIPAVAPGCETTGLTAGSKCSTCNEILTAQTTVSASGHTSAAAVNENVVPSTCTAQGSHDEVVYCSVCNKELSRTKVTDPLADHTAGSAVVENDNPGDCTTDRTYDNVVYCSVCDEELSRTPVTETAPGHKHADAVIENDTVGDCTTDRTYDNVVYCSVCGDEVSRTPVTETAPGHKHADAVIENDTVGDCTTDRTYDNVVYCSVCSEELSRDTVTETAPGHTPVAVPGYAATCTSTGLTEGSKCSVCGEILVAQEEIPVAAHTSETIPGYAATCTSTGLTEGSKCSVCGEILAAQEVIPVIDHTPAEAVTENETAATCSAEGSYDTVVYCSVCDAELSRETTTVEKLPHTPVNVTGSAATCTETGLTDGTECGVCGEVLTAQVEIPAFGHTPAEAVTENNVDATCSAEGSYDTVVYCSVCNAELSRETTTVEKLPHTPVNVTGSAATCTETGLTDGSECGVCGEVLTAQEEIPALGHTPAEAVTENNVDATCTAEGSYDTVVYCSVCNAELSRETVTVDKLSHTEETIPGVAATCTTTGLTEGTKCSVCGEILVAQEEIPVIDHTPAEAVTENEVAATCAATGSYDTVVYCSACNAELSRETTTVEKLPHTEETIPGYAATCTGTGLTDGTKCSVCEETLTAQEEIPALGHTPAEAVTENETAATCTAEGSYDTVVYCSVCDAELSRETVTVDKLSHTEETIPGYAATCTTTGLTEGTKCSVCGEILVAQEVIPVIDHTPAEAVTENEVAATCAATGSYDTVVYCSACNAELSRETVTVEKLPHTEVTIPGYAATCTGTGLTDGTMCSVCEETLVAQEEIPVAAHTSETIPGVAATCTTTGLTEGTKCSVCGEILVAQEEIPVIDHTPAEAVTENEVASTCAATGSYDTVVYCSACNAELSRETVTVEKLPHTEETIPGYAATCTGTGLTDGTKCSVCEETLTAQEEIPALGHTPAEAVTENEVAATCAATGSYDTVVYCSVCDAELSRETTTVEKLPHTEETIPGYAATCTSTGLTEGSKCSVCEETLVAQEEIPVVAHTSETIPGVAATCTSTGLTEGTKCSVCGEILVAQEEIPVIDHTPAEAVTENEVAATCAATGSYDTVVYCSACNAELSRETVTVEKLPHTEETIPGYAATCTGTGLTDGTKCSVCEETLTAQEEIPALGHTPAEAVTENNVDATCTAEGSYDTVVYCSVCNAELNRETVTVDKLSHTEETIPNVAPTCTSTGLTEGTKCSACGEILVAQEEIPVMDHTPVDAFIENETAATCTAEGSYDTVVYCSICDAELSRETVTVEKLPHTEVTIPGYAATCTGTGLTEGTKCSVCGEILVAQEEIPVAAHTSETIPSVAATCTSTGLTEGSKCSVCGEILVAQEVIPVGDHIAETVPGVAATCTTTGLTEGSKCSVCGEILVAQEEIPVIDHTAGDEVIENEIAATCVKDGSYDIVVYCSVCNTQLTRAPMTVPATGEHTYVDGVCSGCGEQEEITYDLSIAGANMSLGSELAINFFVKKADIDTSKDYCIKVTKTYADGRADVTRSYYFQNGDWMDYNSTYYGVKFNGVAAKEMADDIYVQIFYADGTPASDVWTDSIRSYAMRMFAKGNAEKKTMYVDMLNYGAAAQVEFDYGTDDLANSQLTEEQQACATQEIEYVNNLVKGTNYYGTNLNLGSNIALNMYFNNLSQDMYAIATYTDHYGHEQEVRIEGEAFVLNNATAKRYRVCVDTLAVADVRQVVTITVYDTNGTEVASASDSVEGYIARKANSGELYEMVMKFATSAYNSFHPATTAINE